MSSEDILFKTALDAIEKGERHRARDLLTRLIKANRANPEYWVWMSAVVKTSKEHIFCLKEALKLDPDNQAARRGLIMDGLLPLDEKLIIPLQQQRRDWQSKNFPPPTRMDTFLQTPRWMQVAAIGGALVLLAALVYFVIVGIGKINFTTRKQETPVALDLPHFVAATPTAGTLQPTATFSGPTPLWMLMQSTYTPTPLYINTPHPRTENYRSAMRASNRQDWAAMLNFIQQAIPFDPGAPDLPYYAGEAYRQMDDFENAELAYRQALEIDPEFAPAFLGLARVRLALDPTQVKEARQDLREAIKFDPNLLDAYLDLVQSSIAQKDARLAGQYLTQVENLAPQSAQVLLLRGQVLLLQDQVDEAFAKARQAHEADFTLLAAYRLVGEIYLIKGDFQNAVANLATYVLYYPSDSQALTWLSSAHSALGEDDLALEAVNQALQVNAQDYDALIHRGKIYLLQEKGFLAVDDFLEAQKLQPKSFEAALGLGQAYLLENLNRLAYNRLSSALDLAASNAERARVYFWRAQALENLHEFSLAARDWQTLLNLNEEDVPETWRQTAVEHLNLLPTPTRTAPASKTPTRTPTAPADMPKSTATKSPTP